MLAGVAGSINAVGFLGLQQQALSHMTGTITNLGLALTTADSPLLRHAVGILGAFFLGCVVSGLIVRQRSLQFGPRYGAALVLEAILLLAATWCLTQGHLTLGDSLAAMACGLQNALATTYSGAVIRTTHMSGIITDLGIALGLLVRGEPVDWRRIRLYSILLLGFLLGAIEGTLAYQQFAYLSLLIPAAVVGCAGFGYGIFRQVMRRKPSSPLT